VKDWWKTDVSDLRKELGVIEKPRLEDIPEAKPILERRRKIDKKPKTLDEVPKLMTAIEVSNRCRISVWKVYQLIKQGKFHPVYNGRRVFFKETEVLDYLLEILGYEKAKTG
jgi:hypothetical protein